MRHHLYKDSETGEMKFYPLMQSLIDLGLYDFTVEEVKKFADEEDKEKEAREYKEYLRLKEKFENKENRDYAERRD